jgi:uncharacterized protein YegP (UPF0339 family)
MTVEFYKDKVGEWRWRIKAANGRVVGDCAEGYKNRSDCEDMYMAIAEAIKTGIQVKWLD